jgi:hypothetical protein
LLPNAAGPVLLTCLALAVGFPLAHAFRPWPTTCVLARFGLSKRSLVVVIFCLIHIFLLPYWFPKLVYGYFVGFTVLLANLTLDETPPESLVFFRADFFFRFVQNIL